MNSDNLKKDLLAISFLLLLNVIFFYKIIFTDNVFFYRDIYLQFYPWQSFAIDSIKNLKIPLWNQYSYCGYPFLANMQTAVFYPGRWIFYIFSLDIAYKIFIILHVFFAGVGMYVLMRRWKVSYSASIISAIIFSFNGYIITRIEFLSVLAAYVWLPFIIFSIDLSLDKKNIKYAAIPSCFMALQIFSGNPQVAFYSFITVFIFIIYKLIRLKNFFPISVFLCSSIFALAISMIQVLPFMEFVKLSSRSSGLNYILASRWSLEPEYIINFFVPFFFGNPINGTFSGTDQFWTSSCYTGVFSFLFVFILLFYLKKLDSPEKPGQSIFFYLLFIISITLALGEYTHLYKLFYNYIPGFKMIRYPSVIIYISVFSISSLSGFSFDYLIKNKPRIKIIYISFALSIFLLLLFSAVSGFKEEMLKFDAIIDSLAIFLPLLCIFLLLIILFIKNYIRYLTFIFLVIIIIIADLFLYGIEINPTVPSNLLKYETRIIKFLKKEKEQFRIFISPYTSMHINSRYLFENNMKYNSNITGTNYMLDAKSLLLPNTNMIFKIQSATGYDPIRIKYYEEMLDSLSNQISPSETRLLDIMNIKYILSFEKILDKKLVFLMNDSGINLYENKECLPRVFFIKEEDLSFRKIDILPYSAKVTFYSPEKVIVEVKPESNCTLVLSDTYYPGWKVKVDEKERKILKLYKSFRGIKLKKGDKIVEFYYSTFSFKLGACIFASAILLLFVIWLKKK